MLNLDAYMIEPGGTAPPEPVPRDDSPVVIELDAAGVGCVSLTLTGLFFVPAAILVWAAAAFLDIGAGLSGLTWFLIILAIAAAAAIACAYLLDYTTNREKERKLAREREADYRRAVQARERAYRAEVERKEWDAQRLTRRLRDLLKTSLDDNRRLADALRQADRALKGAEKEYADSAFDPYWTAVEEAAGELAVYDLKAQALSQSAQDYYELLKGQRHNFPAFPIRTEALPNPAPVVAEFRRVVRMGQTNFQFANIWEHRKTRRALFAGFRNLGDAVNNLGGTIERSFSGLESSISSGLALASAEQARTREALAEEAGRTRATIDARADEQQELAETQVRLLKDLHK